MPHVALVSFSGLRVREKWLAEKGVQLPGLAARAAAIGQLPSLGLLTLAGMLSDDWTCSYREAGGVDDELVEVLVREQPKFVALSALTASVEEAYLLARRLRAENVPTVLGGLHATACPDEAASHVDAVCSGEGELIWRQVLADAVNGKLRPHYAAVRSTNEFDWPLPRFDLLSDVRPVRWTIQTERGCPLACEFCGASRLLSRFREKPVERIEQELTEICRIDPRPVVELADDNTFAGSRDPEPLLAIFANANVRYFTEVDWRIGERPALVRSLAASGCVQVLIGIESMVFRFPGMGAKNQPLKRILASVDRIQDAGVAVIGCFIVGADGETQASIDRLAAFLHESRFADVQITLNTPFPGTPLRDRLERENRLLPNRGWSHHTLFDVTFQPDQMSVAELEQSYARLLSEVYSSNPAERRTAIRRDVWRRNPVLRGEDGIR
jgi:radical SAM superfamily enzyme YgiQ (UPF0313 family)